MPAVSILMGESSFDVETCRIFGRFCLQFLCVTSLLCILWGCVAGETKWHEFGVNGAAVLCVPTKDLDPNLLLENNESVNLAPRAGWTPGFGFLFSQDVVRDRVRAFHVVQGLADHSYANKLSGSIGFVSSVDQGRYGPSMRARNIEEIWSASGRCADRKVELLAPALYRAKCSVRDDYSSIWNRLPDAQEPMPNPDSFVLATCRYDAVTIGRYAGIEMKRCSRVIERDGFIVDYRFQESNVALIRELDAFMSSKIAEWQNNCPGRR